MGCLVGEKIEEQEGIFFGKAARFLEILFVKERSYPQVSCVIRSVTEKKGENKSTLWEFVCVCVFQLSDCSNVENDIYCLHFSMFENKNSCGFPLNQVLKF